LFVEEKAHGTNKNIDGFYTKTTQKEGFSQLCAKTRYDYNQTLMKSPKPATDNRFKK
jgi:hypothetical protein